MSNQSDQRLVLDLLETGRIDTSEADWLLDRIGRLAAKQPIARQPVTRHSSALYQTERGEKVILEIDADEDTLQAVVQKLSEAICNRRIPDQKAGFFKRLAWRSRPKTAAG